MKRELAIVGAIAAIGTGAVLWRRRRMVNERPRDERARWRVVTVQRSEADVIGAMAPLTALGYGVETRLSTAPGDRGTELGARIRTGSDLRPDDVRIALRETKQLAEAGEIAVAQPSPHGHRKRTPQGALLDTVAKLSEGTGVL
jgi:hypothetical protein